MKDRSKQNFILSCPFPCALGKDTMTQKPEKKSSTATCYKGSTFQLVLGYSCWEENKKLLVTFGRNGIAKERSIR
jgi:hypothetical protein